MEKIKNFTLIVCLTVFAIGCSSVRLNKNMASQKDKDSFLKNLSNFDQEVFPHDIELYSQMIAIVQPELSTELRKDYAFGIYEAVKIYKVNPQIMISLIDTESDFNARMISETGDLSVAQINVDVWNKEFKRMRLPLIESKRLITTDQKYALKTMAYILQILKKRHEKKDRRWYARYHSNTKKYKWDYLKRIEVRMRMLDKSRQKFLAAK